MNERYIIKNLKGVLYQQFLAFCFERSDSFIFYYRSDLPSLSSGAQKFIEMLKPFAMNEYFAKNYKTGEKLFLETTLLKVFEVKCCAESLKIVLENSSELFSWQQPELPEDLSFERGGNLHFFSTAHEQFFVLNLSDEDLADLSKLLPDCLLTREEYFNLPD